MTYGKQIETVRKAKGITQNQLGQALGVSRFTIANWEKEKTIPNAIEAEKINKFLNMSRDELETYNKEQEKQNADIRPLRELMPVPIASEEMAACLGTGLSFDDLYNNSEKFVYIEREKLRAYDDMHRPFAITCHGDCLKSTGLMDGFLAIINPAETPSNGNLALISINGMLSIKFYARRPNGNVALSSDDETITITPKEQEEAEFGVYGAVVSFMPNRRPTKFF